MSEARHIGTDHARRAEWFECPRCGATQRVTDCIWQQVGVLDAKPTLDVCEHRPHIPPSPQTREAFSRERAFRSARAAVSTLD